MFWKTVYILCIIFDIQSMTSNCHTFFLKKLQKSVTFTQKILFLDYIKTKQEKKCDNLECDNLRSWTLYRLEKFEIEKTNSYYSPWPQIVTLFFPNCHTFFSILSHFFPFLFRFIIVQKWHLLCKCSQIVTLFEVFFVWKKCDNLRSWTVVKNQYQSFF